MCIIKYELQNKNNISFVLVDRAAFTKGGFKPNAEMKRKIDALTPFDSNMIELKSSYRESNAQNYAFNNNNFNLINLLKNGASCLLSGKVPKKTKSVLLLVEEMNEIAFNTRINDLKDFPIDDNLPKFKPCYEYKSPIKNNDYYSSIREHWYHTKYYIGTQFSGNLIPYKEGLTINEKEFETVDEVINYEKVIRSAEEEINRFDVFERYFSFPDTVYKKVKINNEIICSYNEQGVNEFLSKNLEGFKKVYFDFESINIAIRPADNFLPYMQAVNQVSMCYNDSTENNIKNVKSGESIVIDVINGLDKNDFKKIIDHILPPCDKSILEDKLKCWSEYKYIVYNDGFEKTRLKEMKDYINEEEYNQKVDVINNNMVDLADLFTIKSNESEKGFIAFKELMGFYSIKKVLPLVMKYDRDTFDSVDCKDYHDLKIGNGGKAQSVSTRRFFKMIKNWDSEEKDLIIYCNNDVRAMVAVEYFVYDILNEKIK